MNQPVESKETSAPKRPEDHISITVKNEKKDFLMSAALVRRLAAYVQGTDDISRILTDPLIQEVMMLEVVMERTPKGHPIDNEANLTVYEISIEDGDKLMDWITEHVLNFFTKTVLKLKTEVDNPDSQIMKLTESMRGLLALVEAKQSAGPSTVNSVTSPA